MILYFFRNNLILVLSLLFTILFSKIFYYAYIEYSKLFIWGYFVFMVFAVLLGLKLIFRIFNKKNFLLWSKYFLFCFQFG